MELYPLRPAVRQQLAANPYWEYWLDYYTIRDGSQQPYYYVHTRGSVMVIPITADGRFVLVRQFRYLWQRESIEFPGGGVAEGSLPIQQALRELQEEAGYGAATIEQIGEFNPMNGVTDERCTVFVARDLSACTRANDPVEETLPLVLSRDELTARIADGTIWDGMTLAAWALFSAWQREQ
ncbi:MAG: NUDIX hydrolase [Bacteroidota bacterium]|nr:NUDIX hydrolase [Candidatus Kapabacteria bacterium]MCS7302508.1 NUDIX hydrolase [Candidatus Kapabacteria bacterium]MCX7937285.1 NUDIX hydrolase [Chlorobiota bacterium]MDW8075548.1 NUDIX hydrolase [Bacteroidota bacterium]MDW8271774.1 NUDIX hydrolase [Bacteroidota bacterium]